MNDYLEHYGIKGMKWGVRRTAEQLGHKIKKAVGSKPRPNGAEPSKRKKRVSEMTDEELTNRLKRMRMEDEYSRLAASQSENQKNVVSKFLKKHTGDLFNQLASKGVTKLVEKVFDKKEVSEEKTFDASKFDFTDSSKISVDKLLEANKWFGAQSTYEKFAREYRERQTKPKEEPKQEPFDASRFNFTDLTKVPASELQEAVKWLQAKQQYENLTQPKEDKEKEKEED